MMKKFSTLSTKLKRGLSVFFVFCFVVTMLDLFVHKHGEYVWNFFGFHSLYGFVACVLLVIVAKGMRRFLMKDEAYYESHQDVKNKLGQEK